MKKIYLFRPFLVLMFLCPFIQGKGQVIITSEPDSIAVVNEGYNYQVTASVSGSAPTYTLTTKPAGMTINATTGLISWTAPSMTSGGKVVLTATNNLGTATQSYYLYIADHLACDPNMVGYWSMDYMTTSTVTDIANGYDAIDNSIPRATQSINSMVGKSALFTTADTEDKFYTVPQKEPFAFTGADDFSVSFWFKNQASGFTPWRPEIMVGKYTTTGRWWVAWNEDTETIEFCLREASTDGDTLKHTTVIDDTVCLLRFTHLKSE